MSTTEDFKYKKNTKAPHLQVPVVSLEEIILTF